MDRGRERRGGRGFGRGRGGRGGRGRGARGGRNPRERMEPEWIPVTKLGRIVKQGLIQNIDIIFQYGIPIKEHQIVDKFLNLKEELLGIKSVQKQTRAGQRTRMKAIVVVGDSNGHVGFGVKVAKETAVAIRGAYLVARLNIIPVRRGHWGNKIGNVHTVPMKLTGKCGSVRLRLVPAPRGAGLVAARVPKALLQLAGVEDVYTQSNGSTKTVVNFASATFDALKKSYGFNSQDLWTPVKLEDSLFEQFSDFLSQPKEIKV